jgi:hypothetical protein
MYRLGALALRWVCAPIRPHARVICLIGDLIGKRMILLGGTPGAVPKDALVGSQRTDRQMGARGPAKNRA